MRRKQKQQAKPGEVLTLAQAERKAIDRALIETRGNKAQAARLLGITRRTLYNKLQQQATS